MAHQFMKRIDKHKAQHGFLLITVIIMLLVISLAAIAASQLIVVNHRLARTDVNETNARMAADAAIDEALQQLNANSSWTGKAETILQNTANLKTTYQTTVTTIDGTHKKVTATGRTYSPASSTTPAITMKYEVQLAGNAPPAYGYSVVAGLGGLEMINGATISQGDVYINGRVDLSTGSQIGTSSNPLKVRVANQVCPSPPDATYPRVCNPSEGPQPITLSGTSKIYGTVMANGQTTGTSMYSPGLVTGSVLPTPMPNYDRAAQKAAVTTTYDSSTAECSSISGNKSWPANLKISGDVDVSNCGITLNGDVWITGFLEMSNSAYFQVANGLTKPPVIMVDDPDGVKFINGAEIRPNAAPNNVGAYIITYWSDASCSPDCLNVTGNALANSQDVVTIEISNTSSLPKSRLYARWSAVELGNGGNVGSIAGQTLRLINSSAVTFSLPVDYSQTAGGGGGWAITSYSRIY